MICFSSYYAYAIVYFIIYCSFTALVTEDRSDLQGVHFARIFSVSLANGAKRKHFAKEYQIVCKEISPVFSLAQLDKES